MEDETPNPLPSDCVGSLPASALKGLQLFNQGKYWDAHESLEDAWRAETGQIRHLYRGVLQVAVAYLHASRGNYPGAIKLHARSGRWLGPFSGVCRGIDVDRLKADFETVMAEVHRLGPERIGELDNSILKPVIYQDPGTPAP